jgi:hypothetical protein
LETSHESDPAGYVCVLGVAGTAGGPSALFRAESGARGTEEPDFVRSPVFSPRRMREETSRSVARRDRAGRDPSACTAIQSHSILPIAPKERPRSCLPVLRVPGHGPVGVFRQQVKIPPQPNDRRSRSNGNFQKRISETSPRAARGEKNLTGHRPECESRASDDRGRSRDRARRA